MYHDLHTMDNKYPREQGAACEGRGAAGRVPEGRRRLHRRCGAGGERGTVERRQAATSVTLQAHVAPSSSRMVPLRAPATGSFEEVFVKLLFITVVNNIYVLPRPQHWSQFLGAAYEHKPGAGGTNEKTKLGASQNMARMPGHILATSAVEPAEESTVGITNMDSSVKCLL